MALMRICYALGYYVIGPLLKLWVRGVELRAQAIAAMTPGFDDHADEAVQLVSQDYPTTPVERRFAADVENWLRKENAA